MLDTLQGQGRRRDEQDIDAHQIKPIKEREYDPRASDVKHELPPFSRLNPKTTISDDVLLFAAGNGVMPSDRPSFGLFVAPDLLPYDVESETR